MTRKYIISVLIILIVFFSFLNKKSKEQVFWEWFKENNASFYSGVDNQFEREKLFDELQFQLKKVNSDLAFEFSPIHENGIREFIVSAEGVKEIFPIVEQLIDKAPELENWKFNAFRQRIPGDNFSIEVGSVKINYSDIYFRYKDGNYGDIGIELNIRNYNGEAEIINATYILLDGLIGEYDITMGIDWIDWVKLDDTNINQLLPITDLRNLIDQKKN
ncbi:hypothetical protein [Sediminitomix flava]|uniref:Uncharacterized protein n=1 Tax=Sediminitomix flava TaxID=379075 RepID=A0A315YXA3_SEDFL|nr:hypothetical protein [Sediminitomix flava]PWJ32691.1 hypothetical protein BC781_1195 [Sediminitomix flava]